MNEIVCAAAFTVSGESLPQSHDQWEFVFCLSGGGEYALGDERQIFFQGDMMVVPPMTPHFSVSDKSCRVIQVFLSQPTLLLKEPCVIRGDGTPHLQAAFEAALYHYRSPHPAKTHLLTAYGGLIACYLSAYQTKRTPSPIVAQIEMDIRTRFSDPAYELETFLRSLPFNYDYLRKLFQRELGITPLQYLNDLRLHAAAEALSGKAETSGIVTEIARMCGFREPLYFSRMFKKKYGLSPSYYASAMADKRKPAPESEDLTAEREDE